MSPMTHLTTDALPDDPWAEIRPYRDDEVAEVLARLAHDPELLDALTRFRLPRLSRDRKSTRLNSSHVRISYAVFCLKKKNKKKYSRHLMHTTHRRSPS